MNALTSTILDMPIQGLHLRGVTLGEQIRAIEPNGTSDGLTLMVFLRHYGCIFCKEMVRDLKAAAEADSTYPALLFFGQGDADETKAFADKLWPEMSIVRDPDRHFYSAMGLGKGSVYQMFGPSVWACGIRAGFKGNFQGRRVGDIWTMPGLFAVDRNANVIWTHEFEHIAKHPNWKTLPAQLATFAKPLSVGIPANPGSPSAVNLST